MQYEIVPFTREYSEQAFKLFTDRYKEERVQNPLLPDRIFREPEWISGSIEALKDNTGVAVLSENGMVGFMLTGFKFPFKGQNAVLVPIYCHASVLEDKDEIYRLMYMHLSGEWVREGLHIHIVSHFAHDPVLKETLYQLGFGAFLAERLRNLSTVSEKDRIEIVEETDLKKLIDIQTEHMDYYRNSPIFISKEAETDNMYSVLKAHSDADDRFLVYYKDEKPCACFIIGTSSIKEVGFLLQNTKTAQIKSAYAQPGMRGKNIGKALLQQTVDWSREHGYERLFVEHETANYYGGRFWEKHFSPYLYFSLRYIDNTLKF